MGYTKTYKRKTSTKRRHQTRKHRGGFWNPFSQQTPQPSPSYSNQYSSIGSDQYSPPPQTSSYDGNNYSQSSNPFSSFINSAKSIFTPGTSTIDKLKRGAYFTTGVGTPPTYQTEQPNMNQMSQQSTSQFDTLNPTRVGGVRRHKRRGGTHRKGHKSKK